MRAKLDTQNYVITNKGSVKHLTDLPTAERRTSSGKAQLS